MSAPTSVVELLQKLIGIPSVNPENQPGTDLVGEEQLALWLKDWLEQQLGAQVELDYVKPGRPNLLARFNPDTTTPRVLFGPHLDTVGIGGMSIEPFAAKILDGKIYGRGACDTKGPMAAMLWALYENRQLLKQLSTPLDFVAFMGEEGHQWGSRHFAAKYAKDYAFAVVGEPTKGEIVTTSKGSAWLQLEAFGKAAHSSMPQEGHNAITLLCECMLQMQQYFARHMAALDHPLLGPSTLNFGHIQGGSRPNIVPDYASCLIDVRYTPALQQAGGPEQLLQQFMQSFASQQQLRLSVLKDNAPMLTSHQHAQLRQLEQAVAPTALVGAPWFSDAAHLNQTGIASVCLGPGDIKQAHTADEFISIAELERGTRQFGEYIRALR